MIGCSSKEEKILPKISDEAIEMAKDQIKGDSIGDTSIQIKDDEIILSVITSPAVNEKFSKDVGERFARLLATFTATINKDVDLEPPSNENLGGIYNYDADGEGIDIDSIIAILEAQFEDIIGRK